MCKEELKKKCVACVWATAACFVVGLGMLITAFFWPPTAKIDDSVLKGVAEVWAFAALATGWQALKFGYDLRIAKGDAEVTINNNNGNK